MASAQVYKVQVIENSAAALLARVRDDEGSIVTPSLIDSISYKVYDKKTGAEVIEGSAEPTEAFYDTLQTDNRWDKDDEGYNFVLYLSGDAFPNASTYRVEVLVTPTVDPYLANGGGDPYYILFDCNALSVYSE